MARSYEMQRVAEESSPLQSNQGRKDPIRKGNDISYQLRRNGFGAAGHM